ncbi:hypothetical protein U9M48_037633 [Paspalum notatum var. saurae]|uniref:Uncharacterized protein n=1 Tax=Paspalum notatum var. saurae TaxID=547442 RepID=A0AAQ3XCM0_PASNO
MDARGRGKPVPVPVPGGSNTSALGLDTSGHVGCRSGRSCVKTGHHSRLVCNAGLAGCGATKLECIGQQNFGSISSPVMSPRGKTTCIPYQHRSQWQAPDTFLVVTNSPPTPTAIGDKAFARVTMAQSAATSEPKATADTAKRWETIVLTCERTGRKWRLPPGQRGRPASPNLQAVRSNHQAMEEGGGPEARTAQGGRESDGRGDDDSLAAAPRRRPEGLHRSRGDRRSLGENDRLAIAWI